MGRFVTDNGASKTRPRGNLLSTVFAVAAVLFAILAVVLYVRDSSRVGVAPVPTAAPGANQIVNVTDALRAQGLDHRAASTPLHPGGCAACPGRAS